VVNKAGVKILGKAGVEMRWIALRPQDVDVEEAGFHDITVLARLRPSTRVMCA